MIYYIFFALLNFYAPGSISMFPCYDMFPCISMHYSAGNCFNFQLNVLSTYYDVYVHVHTHSQDYIFIS